jgi:MFS transporter, SET family, sugar efflux transporter
LKHTLETLLRLPNFLQLSLSALLIGLSASTMLPFFALFAGTRAQMTPLALGVFMTLLAVSGILISMILGQWSDRLPNRKPVLILAMLTSASGYLLLRQTQAFFPMLLIACLFLGTGAAAFPQLFALAKTQFQTADRQASEHGITALRTIFSLAWVVGPGVGALLLGQDNFNRLLLTTAGLYLINALLILCTGVSPVTVNQHHVQHTAGASSSIPLWQIMLSFVLYATSQSMGSLNLPLYVTRVLHGSTSQVGFLFALGAFLEIPVMLSFIFLPRRFGLHSMIVFAFGLTAFYFVMLWFAPNVPVLAVAQLPKAIVFAITASMGMAYFQQLMPERIGTATTLFSTVNSLGSMLSGVVSGGIAQVFGYRVVFIVCGVLTLLAFLSLYSAGRAQEKLATNLG